MPKLKYNVAIPVKDYEDALKKVQKFVKRGFVDDVAWNSDAQARADCTHVHVCTGVPDGEGNIVIVNHGAVATVILERVRDVEKYYVED